MKYSQDSLLYSNKFTLDENVLNLYSALVKLSDFKTRRFLNNFVYVIMDERFDVEIFRKFIEYLKEYFNLKLNKTILDNWFRTKRFPLPLLRVMSLKSKNPIKCLSNLLLQIKFFTNVRGNPKIKLLKTKSSLLEDFNIYFHGYLLGDGCISSNLIKIADGHTNSLRLEYSKNHMLYLKGYLLKIYNLHSTIKKVGNCYHLISGRNKFVSRFIKYFYGYDKDRGIIKVPRIIKKNLEKKKLFYRGFFDADAGVSEQYKSVILKSKDRTFLQSCMKDLKKLNINPGEIRMDSKGVPYFNIYSQDILNYARFIGSTHPRKSKILMDHLKKDSTFQEFKSVSEEKLLLNKFFDLTKILNLRICNVAKDFKSRRKLLGSQFKVAKDLKTFRGNIKRWENGDSSIPINIFLRIMNFKSFKELIFYAKEKNVYWTIAGSTHPVKLPFSLSDLDYNVISYMVPTKEYTKILIKSYGTNYLNSNTKEIVSKIYDIFGLKPVRAGRSKGSYLLYNLTLYKFLLTFFKYAPVYNALNDKELSELGNKWKLDYT